jgi:hypothetical protein
MSFFKRIRVLWWLSEQFEETHPETLKEVINRVLHRNDAIIVEDNDFFSKIDI